MTKFYTNSDEKDKQWLTLTNESNFISVSSIGNINLTHKKGITWTPDLLMQIFILLCSFCV